MFPSKKTVACTAEARELMHDVVPHRFPNTIFGVLIHIECKSFLYSIGDSLRIIESRLIFWPQEERSVNLRGNIFENTYILCSIDAEM